MTDRSNKRLVFVDHEGHFKSELDVSSGKRVKEGVSVCVCVWGGGGGRGVPPRPD